MKERVSNISKSDDKKHKPRIKNRNGLLLAVFMDGFLKPASYRTPTVLTTCYYHIEEKSSRSNKMGRDK